LEEGLESKKRRRLSNKEVATKNGGFEKVRIYASKCICDNKIIKVMLSNMRGRKQN
jgi:hypothetical protein